MKHRYAWQSERFGEILITGFDRLKLEDQRELDRFMVGFITKLGDKLAEPKEDDDGGTV